MTFARLSAEIIPDLIMAMALLVLYAGLSIPAIGGWAVIHRWTRRWRKRRAHRRGWWG